MRYYLPNSHCLSPNVPTLFRLCVDLGKCGRAAELVLTEKTAGPVAPFGRRQWNGFSGPPKRLTRLNRPSQTNTAGLEHWTTHGTQIWCR